MSNLPLARVRRKMNSKQKMTFSSRDTRLWIMASLTLGLYLFQRVYLLQMGGGLTTLDGEDLVWVTSNAQAFVSSRLIFVFLFIINFKDVMFKVRMLQ